MFVYTCIIFEVLNNVPVGIITGTEKKINLINAIQIETAKKNHHFNDNINLPILPTKNKSLEKKRWMFYLVYGITHIKKKQPRHILKWGY